MKVGILTFHRAHNYGALLQCYALQSVLMSMGCDVFVIDYRQPFIESRYRLKWCRVLKLLIAPLKLKRYLQSQFGYNSFFRWFKLSQKCDAKHIPLDFDAYIIGSDQLWSLDCTNGLDPVYTGDFDHKENSRIVGYSISVNKKSLQDISDETLGKILKRFNAISFRESFAMQDVADRVGNIYPQTLDPTLLADVNIWRSMLSSRFKKGKYVLFYEVRKPQKNKDVLLKKTIAFAQKKGLNVVDLSKGCLPVDDFVSAFSNAECVVTSSFHASVFALIFHKPLCAFLLGDGNDNRYKELLETINATSFLYDLSDDIVDFPKGDYMTIQEKLDQLKASSLYYLKRALEL